MYKILTDCSASVRQSMEGLDYYISEGSRAFTDLTETVEQLDLTLDEKKKTLDNLVVAKHYLKTDYKVFISFYIPFFIRLQNILWLYIVIRLWVCYPSIKIMVLCLIWVINRAL